MADDYLYQKERITHPAERAISVTPHDSNELANYSRGIYCGVSGDVKVTTVYGDTVTFVGLAAGIVHPIRAKIIFSTGTTATNIVAVY